MPSHVQDLYQRSIVGLTTEQQVQVAALLEDFSDVFSRDEFDLGNFTALEHTIDTGDAKPFRMGLRRTPPGFQKEEEVMIKNLLDAGVIQESASPWASAPVPVRKKDGSLRFCIDFRKLNSLTVRDAFPLPRIEDCLDILEGTQFVSQLDLTSGFHQIPVKPEDRPKTAFITRFGLLEWVKMPFGLTNSPATFQRAIQLVLRGLNWHTVLAYMDDTMVIGRSFHDHVTNLREVLIRFREYGLKLKSKKCNLFRKETKFLGHIVGSNGLSINPENIRAVTEWPTPTCVREVESFLGFVNYHRVYVKDFAEIASPLYELTGRKATFHWEKTHEIAFLTLKSKMTSTPVMAFPTMDEPFILDTDASQFAIGASLSQVQDGQEKVIAYGSLALTKQQRRYCTTRRELLSVIRFTRQFKHYLLGRRFTVRTDHSSLRWLMTFRDPEGQLARWLEELSQFDFEIQHRPGKLHMNADTLSRRPDHVSCCDNYEHDISPDELPCAEDGCRYCRRAHDNWSSFCREVDDVTGMASSSARVGLLTSWFSDIAGEDLRQRQLDDPELSPVITWLEGSVDPEQQELKICGRATKFWWGNRERLVMKDGVLFSQDDSDPVMELLVAPRSMIGDLLRLSHDSIISGHLGPAKTLSKLRQKYYWYQQRKDVDDYVRSCNKCNTHKKNFKNRAGLGMYHAGVPMERIHIDMLGPFPESPTGNKYILMVVDQFTKWVEGYPTRDQTAETVAAVLSTQFFSRFGCPLEIHSDMGKNFESKLIQELCRLMGVHKTRTTPYHPASNGQVERYNRTLLPLMRCHVEEVGNNWDTILPFLTSAIRSTIHRGTGYTANMLMLGREVMHPVDIYTPTESREDDYSDFVSNLKNDIFHAHERTRNQLKSMIVAQKRDYDSRLRESHYSEGDLVYMINHRRTNKLSPIFIGPFVVIKKRSPVTYVLRGIKKTFTAHHDNLKSCKSRTIPKWASTLSSFLTGKSPEEESEEIMEGFEEGIERLFREETQQMVAVPVMDEVDSGPGTEELVPAEDTSLVQTDQPLTEESNGGGDEHRAEVPSISIEDLTSWKDYKYLGKLCLASSLGKNPRDDLNACIFVYEGDITTLKLDCIVSSSSKANRDAGLSRDVHVAAGDELKLPSTEDLLVTTGCLLPADRVMHATIPALVDASKLRKLYKRCLHKAVEENFKTLAMPLMATGTYGLNNLIVADRAAKAAREFLEEIGPQMKIVFCVRGIMDRNAICAALCTFFPTVGQSRTGRKLKRPARLDDYVTA